MNISVIVCTKGDRKKELGECLKSIRLQSHKPFEIIVDKTEGMCHARNHAIQKAHGDIIVFFDDDVIVFQDYLMQLEVFFEIFKEAAAVTGKVVNEKQALLYWHEFPVETRLLFGSNMAFRRDMFYEFRFDENLMKGYYFDDDQISADIGKKYKIFFNPLLRIYHNHAKGGAGQHDTQKEYMMFYTFSKNCKYLWATGRRGFFHMMLTISLAWLRLVRRGKFKAARGLARGFFE